MKDLIQEHTVDPDRICLSSGKFYPTSTYMIDWRCLCWNILCRPILFCSFTSSVFTVLCINNHQEKCTKKAFIVLDMVDWASARYRRLTAPRIPQLLKHNIILGTEWKLQVSLKDMQWSIHVVDCHRLIWQRFNFNSVTVHPITMVKCMNQILHCILHIFYWKPVHFSLL